MTNFFFGMKGMPEIANRNFLGKIGLFWVGYIALVLIITKLFRHTKVIADYGISNIELYLFSCLENFTE